ncbi:response regulator transcription factor [Marinoscillum sp.]|uniref:response regulator transcription factor n=1 Tax=Marinoscillum sp. TaxID=2024838 RepID=UPI003BAB0E38
MLYKLFLIDDHKVVRDGIKAMLLGRPDIQVIGEAASAKQALDSIYEKNPDMVMVDLKLPDANGALLVGELSQKLDAIFMLLTSDPNPVDLERARANGAMAFLTKDMDTSEYFQALDQVINGQKYISSAFSNMLINEALSYTPREIEVLRGFADGLTYKEIGAQLDMSPRTVETHKNNLMKKMDVKSIVEMVRIGIKQGIIQA